MPESLWFSNSVTERLRHYVYRLVDPRDNETFYVGKGVGNRVFIHVRGEVHPEQDALSAKLRRIRDIRSAGLNVIHFIHRHDMDELTVFEVEAALIDAYPDTNNIMSGHASDERGLMSTKQIIDRYEAREALFQHRAVLISINRLILSKASIYEAVRYAWKLDARRAQAAEIVLAVDRGLIVGVFIAEKWMVATRDNFPDETTEFPKRWGFLGSEASIEIANLYLGKRVPDSMRKPGAANPVRYV